MYGTLGFMVNSHLVSCPDPSLEPQTFRSGFCLAALNFCPKLRDKIRNGKPGFEDTTREDGSLVPRPPPVFDRLQYAYCRQSKLEAGTAWERGYEDGDIRLITQTSLEIHGLLYA